MLVVCHDLTFTFSCPPSFNSVISLNLLDNLKRLCCTFTFVQSSDFEVWSVLS
ncbi:expressed unknown protein [Ectocarpus siliculosus]|uniref:Uncharacterized protein n=1 Tax=Ectocarpus siliculosus TaxID=2880 RepID=D7FIW8_ECTSI|nr:expressed unknown protein [Ectocarpus siliculosus]|eukprot:CBJ28916.1 expressed unknown protein [Ectocarpus siliculosus]